MLSSGNLPRGGLPRNIVDRITDLPDMTSAVDRGRKAITQLNSTTSQTLQFIFLQALTVFPPSTSFV